MPKESKADSILTVTAGKQFVVLQRTADGSYTGKLRMDIFADIDGSEGLRLTITTDGVMNTEVFARHELSELWYRYIPGMAIQKEYNTSYDQKTLNITGDLKLEVFIKNDVSKFIQDSFRLCTEVGGKITDEEDISSDIISHGFFYRQLKYSANVEPGESFRLIVTAKDSNGYFHEYTVFDNDPNSWLTANDMKIFDAAGNQLN